MRCQRPNDLGLASKAYAPYKAPAFRTEIRGMGYLELPPGEQNLSPLEQLQGPLEASILDVSHPERRAGDYKLLPQFLHQLGGA